jgi:Holliday junction resolvase RusA-like endonuclease
MHQINIKPLSVNLAWQGGRKKSKNYNDYEKHVFFSLPKLEIPPGNLRLELEFGLSNSNADIDNPVKPFLDILQKKYGFNDSRVYEAIIKKVIVPRTKEYTKFLISSI